MMNVYVELDYSDGKTQTRVFSVKPDDLGEGRLMKPLIYSVKVRTWVQNEATSSGISKIMIANHDGYLDDFADYTFIQCRIKRRENGATTTIFTGPVDRAILDGENNLQINVKSAINLLDVKLQDDFFPASETSDTGSGTNTYYGLSGQPRPIALGRPKSIRPVLAKRSNNEYHIHEDLVNAINDVYDRGDNVSYTKYTKGLTLDVDPTGVIVADVRGANKVGLTGNARTIDELIEWIFNKMSFSDYSTSDLSGIDTDKGYFYSYYQDNTINRTVFEVFKWLCDSHTGWFYADEQGDIRFGYLDSPAVTADVDITKNDVISKVNRLDDLAPNLTTKMGNDKNWYVYESDEIVSGADAQDQIDLAQQYRNISDGANTIDSFYTDKQEPFDSLLQLDADSQSEIDHVTNLYSSKRYFYHFDTDVDVQIGQTVNMTYPRYGLDTGVNLICLGRQEDLIDNTYRLTLWG